jgi:hypothetical protein
VESEGRREEEEELIWRTVYKNRATSSGPEKTDEVQNFSHVCYNTLQSESFATGIEHNSPLLLACRRTYIMMVL